MGLDMYLTRNVYLANYDHDKKGQELSQAVLKALGVENKKLYDSGSIEIALPVAYWRKANAIHGWFVKHVQEGVDDCGKYDVSREQLEELKELCQDILSGKRSKEDMPPIGGFFFGDTTNEQYYLDDLKETVDKLDNILKEPNITKYDSFCYTSSW